MPDVYDELDVFGRPKSRVGGVPYVNEDNELTALQNYVLNLKAKEAAIESGARTVRKPKEIAQEGGRLPGYVHQYEPAYTVQEQERLRDEQDPVRFMPIVRRGAENVHAIYDDGFDTPRNILTKTVGLEPTFEDRWNNNLVERYQMWPEKMVRSGASLPGDVMSGRVVSGPGLRATDFSDIPGAPNPLGPMIERTQDLAGMAMGGSIPELAARGADRNALGSGFVPKIIKGLPPKAANNNAAIPGPVPFPERLYTNYARAIKPEDVLTSEPVWGGAERLSNETGIGYSEAFAQIANEFWRRQGANKYITPELAQAYIKRARSGLTLAADDEVGGAVGASRNALKDLTRGSFGGNVPPSAARNIGRETMPEALAKQRSFEGLEAAIRDPETKKVYSGVWHEEVLDKIAKDRGVPKNQLPANLVKGYINDRGRFMTDDQLERQYRSKTAMFRADDEVGAAVAAMHATEGKAPELKVGQANLPAVIPQGRLPAPGTALNPVSNRRGFLRGARDLMAAASNANKIVTMAEKLGQTPIPKNPKVPLKEIWKREIDEFDELSLENAHDRAFEVLGDEFDTKNKNVDYNKLSDKQKEAHDLARDDFVTNHPDYQSVVDDYLGDYGDWEGGTQFSHHQLPGATNYREHLMQMPDREAEREALDFAMAKRRTELGAQGKKFADDPEHARLMSKYKDIVDNKFYGNWDEPDIIGHSRVNDRQIPGVGKALHIEEIGSQLHEKGQKYGYKDEKPPAQVLGIREHSEPNNTATHVSYKLNDPNKKPLQYFRSKIEADNFLKQSAETRDQRAPDVPFKKTYVDLAVNRMLHEAATQDYDAVSWTPHELQKKNYGGDSNKEILPRIEALAKKYGGKIEKHKVEVRSTENSELSIEAVEKLKELGNKWNKLTPGKTRAQIDADPVLQALEKEIQTVREQGKKPTTEDVYHVKLTPEMKRIFGHEDFSFFPKPEAGEGSKGFKLRSDSEAGAAIGALRNSVAPKIANVINDTLSKYKKDDPKIKTGVCVNTAAGFSTCADFANDVVNQIPGAKVAHGPDHTFVNYNGKYYDSETPQGVNNPNDLPHYKRPGARKYSKNYFGIEDNVDLPAPTFYSGLSRTIERAPFETATPSQWMKHLRDTVGARQAEEFEHVGLEGRLGPLAEAKAPVERKAQAALEAWKVANKGQRPPKELTDAASNENKRIVEQRLAEKGSEKPLTKAELLAHVASNQPKFKEIVKRGDEEKSIQARAQEIMDEEYPNVRGNDPRFYDYFNEAVHLASDELEGTAAKYSDYQLPGGTNYREHLMTMPVGKKLIPKEIKDRAEDALNKVRKADPRFGGTLENNGSGWSIRKSSDMWLEQGKINKADYDALHDYINRESFNNRTGENADHYSSHWDEPNVIVHTRINDRMLGGVADVEEIGQRIAQAVNATPETIGSGAPAVAVKKGLITPEEAADWSRGRAVNEFSDKKGTGVRSLHAEEFQSDLHQEGRKKGYKRNNEILKREYQGILNKANEYSPHSKEYEEWYAKASKLATELTDSSRVPNFPFKKSWPDLAIKRWLREAVDNDYDAVSWTPGEAQRDRFQLAHSLEALHYNNRPNNTYTLYGDKKGGGDILINRGMAIKEDELPRYVGEAMAEKIKKGEGQKNEDGSFTFNNADLKVGGEGLVSFYDKTIKGKVEALVERFGGKVEKHKIKTPSREGVSGEQVMDDMGLPREQHQSYWRGLSQQKRDELMEKYRMKHGGEEGFVWSVKLTPEMKRAIRSEGFPLFTAGPVMTPVDHDPFDEKQKAKPKLEPVEHDPFAQPTPDLGGALNKLVSSGYRPRPRPVQNGFGRRQ